MPLPPSPEIDLLFEAILSIQTIGECRSFFEDLTTVQERNAMAQRLAVAKLLSEGKNYNEVIALTGASSATISRVARCLGYGADGYTACLQRLQSNTVASNREKE